MPFFPIDIPSISLSLVKAALERAGFECDLEYLNVEFGKRLGVDLYGWIAMSSPSYLLFGDLIFAPALHDSHMNIDRLRELVAPSKTLGVSPVPDEIVEAYPDLVETARHLLYDKLREIDWSKYGLVGFGTIFQIAPALAMARLVKTFVENPPPVILGGSNCEGEMGEYLHRCCPWIDYVCRGEGEGLIVELAQNLSDGSVPLDLISGLVWRDNGRTRCNGSRADLHSLTNPSPTLAVFGAKPQPPCNPEYELDVLPIPKYDDWLHQVKGVLEDGQRRLPIETGRGCWYGAKQHCTFCGENGEMIAFRRKSAERALEEFKGLMESGVKIVGAVDNILDYRYFKTLLPELAKLEHGMELRWEIKSNLTHEQVQLLHASGIVWTQAGIESLSTPVLHLMRKGVTALQNIRLLRYAAEFAIGTSWNLLYGFPGENPSDYQEMAELLPALSHLEPPLRGCGRLCIERFSPLYVNRDAEGLTDVKPRPAYYEIYPFERDIVARMAYSFEYGYRSHPDPNSYILPLVAAVRGWLSEVGAAALLSIRRGDTLHLLDTRGIATQPRATLHGFDLDVFTACQHGATLNAIAQNLQRSPDEIQSVLDSFVDRHWVLHLDGKFLSLAVPVDAYAPRHIPLSLVENSILERYCTQMVRIRRGFTPAMSVPSFDILRSTVSGRKAAVEASAT
jgi:ribosomal peptide maturation radical SAM protein 1